jgi:hypothetical protein
MSEAVWILCSIVVALAAIVGFAMYVVSDAFPYDEGERHEDGYGDGCVQCDEGRAATIQRIAARKGHA